MCLGCRQLQEEVAFGPWLSGHSSPGSEAYFHFVPGFVLQPKSLTPRSACRSRAKPAEQASQAAERWHLRASGVKTPDEFNALTSWLKLRPANLPTLNLPTLNLPTLNLPTFSAACSAGLVLNFACAPKLKCKQAAYSELQAHPTRLFFSLLSGAVLISNP
jgi:hypothetical protein